MNISLMPAIRKPWQELGHGPGTKGLEHRIGGLEKMNITGNISYVPENHQVMTDLREAKVERIAQYIPEQEVYGNVKGGEVLIVGWGERTGI